MEDAILSFPPRNGLAAAPRPPLAERLWQALGQLLRDCFPVWADTPPYGDHPSLPVFVSEPALFLESPAETESA